MTRRGFFATLTAPLLVRQIPALADCPPKLPSFMQELCQLYDTFGTPKPSRINMGELAWQTYKNLLWPDGAYRDVWVPGNVRGTTARLKYGYLQREEFKPVLRFRTAVVNFDPELASAEYRMFSWRTGHKTIGNASGGPAQHI